jgi:NAD(P)-dependent dehydrogenase (short-subunit alcohol dehydrogenase family)
MAEKSVVLITGVTQGIGKRLVEVHLSRPDTTVIGSIRNSSSPAVEELKAYKAADGSKLILVHIESTSPEDPKNAVAEIEAAGVDHIDVVIANAGGSPPVEVIDEVTTDNLVAAYLTNAVGPVLLFQAVKPLLQKSKNPKWATISSGGGSTQLIPVINSHVTPAYGAAKAALNWLSVAITSTNPWLTTVIIHPGLVQTGPGNWVAQQHGMSQAPDSIDDCVTSVNDIIDKATREESANKFYNASDGTLLPW